MVKNLPCNAGDMSSIPGWGTKIPHIKEHLSTCTITKTQETNYINIFYFLKEEEEALISGKELSEKSPTNCFELLNQTTFSGHP